MRRWVFVHGREVAGKAARKTWRRHLPAWLGVTTMRGRPCGLVLRVGDVSWWFAVCRLRDARELLGGGS